MTKPYLYLFVSLWGSSVFAQSYNVTTFYDPNAFSVQISGVNAGGIVVGYEVQAGELNGTSEGFKYDHGAVTVIHCPRALSPSASGGTGVSGIDSEGNILGQYTSFPKVLPGGLSGNFLLDTSGTFSYFDQTVNPAPTRLANGFNNKGEFVGGTSAGLRGVGFKLSGGVYQSFSVPGFAITTASGVNDQGQIVGSAYDVPGTEQGFFYSGTGLQMVNFPNAFSTSVMGINDYGVAAGYYTQPPSYGGVGFIYDHGTFTSIALPNLQNVYVYGITNFGALYGSGDDKTLGNVGFVAMPLPPGQPTAVATVDLSQRRQ